MLDKTGTLTLGEPSVTDIWVKDQKLKNGADRLLYLAASVEEGSEHPLGEAIVRAARERELQLAQPEEFEAQTGQGVIARVGGHLVTLGNAKMMKEGSVPLEGLEAEAERLQSEAKTVVWMAVDGEALGLIGIADTLKPGSKEAVHQMHQLGLTVIMMTGDNAATASKIAEQVGIDRVLSEVLPGEKASQIQKLQSESKGLVGMVGDGINDARLWPSRRGNRHRHGYRRGHGDVGRHVDARGSSLCSQAIALSKATLRTIKQNLFWAFFYNVVLIPVAAGSSILSQPCPVRFVLYIPSWLPWPWLSVASPSSPTACA